MSVGLVAEKFQRSSEMRERVFIRPCIYVNHVIGKEVLLKIDALNL